ncbi:hypothetical protein IFR05_014862 [Cadophora sp. M221]|nr:hypothetical protein IFR05_014862 [Cadophora sp. M221]
MHITTSIFLLSFLFTSTTSCAPPPSFPSVKVSTSKSDSSINASPQLLRRDVTTILSDTSSISTLISTLTKAAQIYTSSLTKTLDLASTVRELKSALAKATMDVGSEEVFDKAGSEMVVSSVGELTLDIRGLLEVLSLKTPVIAEAGYTSVVVNELETLITNTDALFVELEGKAVVGDVDKLKALQETVGEAFGKTVVAFSGPVTRHDIFSGIGFGIY